MNPKFVASKIELWPLARLNPYARKFHLHPASQINELAASEQDFGLVNPASVNPDGSMIAGEGRVLAALQNGMPHFPVIVLGHLSPAQVRALRIADNRLAQNAVWDAEKLSVELAELLEEKIDLTTLGFGELELKRLVAELENQTGHTEVDAVPDSPAQPITKLGDLWILDEHRYLCGDSTSLDCLKDVLEGKSADLIYGD